MTSTPIDDGSTPSGQLVQWTKIKTRREVTPGTQETVWQILGWCWLPGVGTGNRIRVWGLAHRMSEPYEMSPISYHAAGDSSPTRVLASLTREGYHRFVFHAGEQLWVDVTDLRRAFRDLGLIAPSHYRGVPVPSELVTNWDEPEAHWWRAGIAAGLSHAVNALTRLATNFNRDMP